ncbi:MAG: alkyl hydroperoxide reductase subunit F [Pseudomonadota bacterium]
MKIDKDLLASVKSYMSRLTTQVELVIEPGLHSKKSELVEFLKDVESTSELISVRDRAINERSLRSAISFEIYVNNEPSGAQFSGIPSGHEFNSLILAILYAGGVASKLDATLQQRIKNISSDLHFEVVVSLSCHNCPEIVQTLQQIALLNPKITSEMIDGGDFQELIEERNIQGVPAVYLNKASFAQGKISASDLIERLLTVRAIEFSESSEQFISEKIEMFDVAVVGGGPAGAAAAIYAVRKGLKVAVIADRIGGQMNDTQSIENMISTTLTTGPKLSGSLKEHLLSYPVTLKEHLKVKSIDLGDEHWLTLSTGEKIQAKAVVFATGAQWRELGVPGEKENIGRGVAYCPHCDGPFFKDKDVAVIGGGNSGVEAALDLASIVRTVTLIEFGQELRADKILQDHMVKTSNIKVITNAETQKINDNGKQVENLVYRDRASNEMKTVEIAGIFIQIGLIPNSQLIKDQVEMTRFGEIIINERCETSRKGVFACGDVTTVPYKQIVIAMGEGSKAGLSAFEYLLKNN